MKKLNWRAVGLTTLVCVQGLISPVLPKVQAESNPIQQEKRTEQSESELQEVASLLPAKEEPEEHRKLREEKHQKKVEQAKKEAKEEEERLIKERIQEWEDNFPKGIGTSMESTFIDEIAKDSVAIARDAGLYPSVLMAQAGLESGWGGSGLSVTHHNLFGIKGSFKGATANLETWEEVDQTKITIRAGFRSYPSKKESILDYAQLLKNGLTHSPNFYKGTWISETSSYKDVTSFLQGRYATDSQYANKLNRIIERLELDRFDAVEELDTNITVEPVIPEDPPLPEGQYVVKEGDTIQLILHKTNLTLEELLAQNDLPDSRIHVQQVVNVNPTKDLKDELNTIVTEVPSLFSNDQLTNKVNPSSKQQAPDDIVKELLNKEKSLMTVKRVTVQKN